MAATVCLITAGPNETYFVNRVHDEVGVDLVVIVEGVSVRERLARALRVGGAGAVLDFGLQRVASFGRRRARRAELDRCLGDRWRELTGDVPRLVTPSTADPTLVDTLRRLGDVDLLVHSNVLVDMRLVGACRSALNLHWGLSPYYRGTHCTEWALLRGDVRNIGVTVHELARAIDAGRIVGQRRATIAAHDTAHSIDAQLTVLGADIVVESLRILAGGGSLASFEQDLSLGELTLKSQWTRERRREVARLERAGLGTAIARPLRPALPIVEGPIRRGAAGDAAAG